MRKIDPVALRIEAPVFENQLGDHPDTAADALDRDVLAFEIGGRLNRRRRDHGAVELIGQAGDENEIEPAGHGTERRNR